MRLFVCSFVQTLAMLLNSQGLILAQLVNENNLSVNKTCCSSPCFRPLTLRRSHYAKPHSLLQFPPRKTMCLTSFCIFLIHRRCHATSKTMFQLVAHFSDSTNLNEAYVQATKNKTHGQIMLHSAVLRTLTESVLKKVVDRKS